MKTHSNHHSTSEKGSLGFVFQSNHYFMVQKSIVGPMAFQVINSTFAKAINIKSMFELTQMRSHQFCKETQIY